MCNDYARGGVPVVEPFCDIQGLFPKGAKYVCKHKCAQCAPRLYLCRIRHTRLHTGTQGSTLQTTVARELDVDLDKTQQMSNWECRPLTEEQVISLSFLLSLFLSLSLSSLSARVFMCVCVWKCVQG